MLIVHPEESGDMISVYETLGDCAKQIKKKKRKKKISLKKMKMNLTHDLIAVRLKMIVLQTQLHVISFSLKGKSQRTFALATPSS